MDAWWVLYRAHSILLVVTQRVRVGSTGGPDAATHTAISRSRTRLGLWWERPVIVILHQETQLENFGCLTTEIIFFFQSPDLNGIFILGITTLGRCSSLHGRRKIVYLGDTKAILGTRSLWAGVGGWLFCIDGWASFCTNSRCQVPSGLPLTVGRAI